MGWPPKRALGDRAAPNVTRKAVELRAVAPVGSCTVIRPEVARGGTATTIWVPAAFTLGFGALTPLKATVSPEANPEPDMVTTVPTGPDVGWNPVMAGPEAVAGA